MKVILGCKVTSTSAWVCLEKAQSVVLEIQKSRCLSSWNVKFTRGWEFGSVVKCLPSKCQPWVQVSALGNKKREKKRKERKQLTYRHIRYWVARFLEEVTLEERFKCSKG